MQALSKVEAAMELLQAAVAMKNWEMAAVYARLLAEACEAEAAS